MHSLTHKNCIHNYVFWKYSLFFGVFAMGTIASGMNAAKVAERFHTSLPSAASGRGSFAADVFSCDFPGACIAFLPFVCFNTIKIYLLKGTFAMIEYMRASQADREEIIDLINYVFSYSHCPHEFKTMMPKSYAEDAKELGAIHYIAKKDGRIRSVIANRVIDVMVLGEKLRFGLIGNVAVHPYSRGEGFMKELLGRAIDESRSMEGIDIMVLGGQRQRYGYFGFENAGYSLGFTVSKDNIRHCFADLDCSALRFCELREAPEEDIREIRALYEQRPFHAIRDREEYFNIMATWGAKCRLIYKNDALIGYMWGTFGETVLRDEADFAMVLKAVFEKNGLKETFIGTQPFEQERAAFLASICENNRINMGEMILVLNWEKTIRALLTFKGTVSPLEDGTVCVDIAGEKLTICVSGGAVQVTSTPDRMADITLTHSAAHQLFFGLNSILYPDARMKNWTPLPFMIDGPDTY